LPTAGSLQIYAKFKTGITPVMTANATVDYVALGKPAPVMKWQEHDSNVSSASINLVNTLPRTGLISMLSLLNTSDSKAVSDVQMKLGRVTRWDMPANENTTKNLFNNLNPAAGAYHMVFGAHNGIVDYFDASQAGDLSLDVTFASAATGTFTIVSQRYEMPKGF
jgi:hypothetical protein